MAGLYLDLDRLPEARADCRRGPSKKLDFSGLHVFLYQLAFLQNDSAGMAKQVAWVAGKPGVEDTLLEFEADTAAYSGRLPEAREFSRRAVDSAKRAGEEDSAAMGILPYVALGKPCMAMRGGAHQRGSVCARAFDGPGVEYFGALALALTGDAARAHTMADDLANAPRRTQ